MLLLVVLLAGLIIWRNPVAWLDKWLIKDAEIGQKLLPIENTGETTTIYGVKIQNECFEKLQNFDKVYGVDYSKCLVNFNFDQEYCGGFDPETQALSDVNVVVILDSSGSMAGEIGGQKKIDIAKKAVSDFLTKMPKGVNTGLVVYGHKGSNSALDKGLSCSGTEEIVELGKNNSENIINAMSSFSPRGWTPIADSLSFAKEIFNSNGEGDKDYLVLVSDGDESCDGNPLAAAEKLKLEVKGIKLIVIGFAIDAQAKKTLEGIAVNGGGSYLAANNSSDISNAFNDQLLVVKKDCIKITLAKIFSMHKASNLNNLNCWLAEQKKESENFTASVLSNPYNTNCNQEVSDAIKARQIEFWNEMKQIEEKGSETYGKVELDYNNQLKALGN